MFYSFEFRSKGINSSLLELHTMRSGDPCLWFENIFRILSLIRRPPTISLPIPLLFLWWYINNYGWSFDYLLCNFDEELISVSRVFLYVLFVTTDASINWNLSIILEVLFFIRFTLFYTWTFHIAYSIFHSVLCTFHDKEFSKINRYSSMESFPLFSWPWCSI